MSAMIQKLSIRLLKEDLVPSDGVRESIDLKPWPKIEGAQIALDTMGGSAPKWSKFLDLTDAEKKLVWNNTAFGLVFVHASGRWFAVSFGMGHVKLDPSKFVQDFGLKVVLNSVDPKQLKSADVRTPDENTLSRRSQTSRGSDQTAFAIDVERDIVRGLAGTPKDEKFALRVAGTDSLSMDRKMQVQDLVAACDDAYAIYQKTDYKTEFGWIDHIRHVREKSVVGKLEIALVAAIDSALKTGDIEGLHLAFPIIYDPEKAHWIRYKGFRSSNLYPNLDLEGYLDALKERGKSNFVLDDLANHRVHEADEAGRDCGGKWKICDCLAYETDVDGHTYVLSGGRWYQIDVDLAKDVADFFSSVQKIDLPVALKGENEEIYNERLKSTEADMLCMDRKLITPTGATSAIEVCDFLGRDQQLIHIKDKTSSSRLSHLFNQGTVSARVLILDGAARDRFRTKISIAQTETSHTGFENLIAISSDEHKPGEYTVVYGVLVTSPNPRLPFFSLVSFRQAARELQALGYKFAFSWITKPVDDATKKKKSSPSSDQDTESSTDEPSDGNTEANS
jgi:uncharacterized protein (TIGR04141 family)